MADLLQTIILGSLLGIPVLCLSILLDKLLINISALIRRRLWLTVISICLVLTALPALQLASSNPSDYWLAAAQPDHSLTSSTGSDTQTNLVHEPQSSAVAQRMGLLHLLGSTYFAGLLLILLRFVIAQFRTVIYLRKTAPVRQAALLRQHQRLVQSMPHRTPIRLCWHLDNSPPAAAGLLYPTILLPRSAIHWDQQQLRCVLAHEIAHTRHHDNLWRLVAILLCALHWFNPMAWVVLGRLRTASEMAADEFASSTTDQPADYAAAMVQVVRSLRSRYLPLASTADYALPQRVTHLLSTKRKTGWLHIIGLGLVPITGAATAAFSISSYTQPEGVGYWAPQQIRWESAQSANGVFLHGDVELKPGQISIGREGLIVALNHNETGLSVCSVWRHLRTFKQTRCDTVSEAQPWFDQLLSTAANSWAFNPDSPLASYPRTAVDQDFSGSHITGIPGISRNPNQDIIQSGWVDDDGARVGVFQYGATFTLAFRYRPDRSDFQVLKQVNNQPVLIQIGGGWKTATTHQISWFNNVLRALQ